MSANERLLGMQESARADLVEFENELRTARGRIAAFTNSLEVLNGDDESAAIKRKVQDKIEKESEAARALENKITEAQGRVSAYDETLKLMSKGRDDSELRKGTEIASVCDLLRQHRRPMSLSEIIKGIGVLDTQAKRNSIRGSLSRYARDGRVFTKDAAPDTFGLNEFVREGEEV